MRLREPGAAEDDQRQVEPGGAERLPVEVIAGLGGQPPLADDTHHREECHQQQARAGARLQ
jgi:hypothetical protein